MKHNMTPKNPTAPLALIPKGKYADYVAALGPAPTGFRYLKVGEKFNNDTDYCLSLRKLWEKYKFPVFVDDHRYPCITPSPTKRDSKGRFSSQKVADEKLKAVHSIDLEDLKKVIDGDKEALYTAFSWASTEQGHSYWSARRKGDAAITASDIDYLKRLYALKGGKLEPETPKVAKLAEVPLAERVKKVASIEIPAIDLVLAGKVDQLSLAFYWASTEQGRRYWEDRRWAKFPLSAADLEYLKALRAEKERQLGRKVGPHDTRLQALTRAYEALGNEIAALKAELG